MSDARTLASYLRSSGVAAALVAPEAPVPTVDGAAAALGVGCDSIVKSILFEEKRGARRPILVVLRGDCRVDASKVAAVASLSSLRLAPPGRVLELTGYAVGGVPPVGHARALAVLVDARVLERDLVYGGGGDERHMLGILARDIVQLTGARVADVSIGDA